MPLGNMFKAFSGSRNRLHRADPAAFNEYPQGYPPGAELHLEPTVPGRLQPQALRRSNTVTSQRREPLFTPLPSRAPTDAEEYHEGYVRVDNPDAVMGGALNARPGRLDTPHSSIAGDGLGSSLSDTLSERDPRENLGRIHDPSRLLDRPPQLQRPGSYHSGRGDRPIDPDGPIVMSSSPSSVSGSDHTVEGLRTPLSVHPNERVIPPLPRHYSGSYVPGSRPPTDIYGGRQYDAAHDIQPHHNDGYGGGYGRSGYHAKDSGPVYYIIPGGMNVIFRDEHGNEITRVGDFSGRSRPSRPGPYVVQDQHGRELYRYDGHDRGSHNRGSSDPPIVRIDAYPNFSRSGRERSYSSHSYHSDPSYSRGQDYHPDHRDSREKSWRDPRDNRYRGYSEHSDYDDHREHRDHRSYRDLGYRDHGGSRGYGGYREHDDHKSHGRANIHLPGRVPSRASHRSYSHASQMSPQYPDAMGAIPDDRRSGQGRDYTVAHPGIHQVDEPDITDGMQDLHI